VPRRILIAGAAALAAYLLFFHAIGNVGLLSADEPRYASIGRHMAQSGDWITPTLWGQPWFEKPALLYWMIGAAFRAGLHHEIAVRLPIALASTAFLLFFWLFLRRHFNPNAALYSTLILATSAGWLAFSQIGVTDLPLAVTLSTALLLAMPWASGQPTSRLWPAGLFLALAILAKGLVPLILILPALWMGRNHLAKLLPPALICMTAAAPWYLLCYQINGAIFFNEFILKHHFSRFSATDLQHVQPFWFYLPVLLAGLFPWTPLTALLYHLKNPLQHDLRIRYLTLWFLVGFLFFSASVNKLPGYLLPILPPLAALLGISLDKASTRWPLALSALLLSFIPVLADILPQSLRSGISRADFPPIPWIWLAAALITSLLILRIPTRPALLLITTLTIAAVTWTKHHTYPILDETVSARSLHRKIPPNAGICIDQLHRTLHYGLNYYSNKLIPDCESHPAPLRLSVSGSRIQLLLPQSQ